MRILFSSTPLAGHFGPMAPFVRASVRAGHDAMVVGPAALAAPAEDTGAAFWAVAEPDAERMARAFEVLRGLSHADANRWMIGEIFGRLRSEAALPGLREAIRSYRPDLVLREMAEFGAAVAAEVHDLPHARVAIGVNATEELVLDLVAGPVDELRQASGLPPDPNARRLREASVLTLFPAALDDPGLPGATSALRFRDPAWASTAIDGGGGPCPFVYITFGTETGRMPIFETVYRAAVRAVEVLDVDVLITVGTGCRPGRAGRTTPARPGRALGRPVNGPRPSSCGRLCTAAVARSSVHSPPGFRSWSFPSSRKTSTSTLGVSLLSAPAWR